MQSPMPDYQSIFRNEADIAETKRLFAAGLLSFGAMVTILEEQYSRPSLTHEVARLYGFCFHSIILN